MDENVVDSLELKKDEKIALVVPVKDIERWNELLSEWDSKGQEQWFQCSFCEKVFLNVNTLREHHEMHDIEGTLDDPSTLELLSEEKCGNKSNIDSIISTPTKVLKPRKHDATKKCVTTKVVKKTIKVSKPVKKKVRVRKTYVCDFCGKSFSQSYNLKGHVLTHTGEKPYKCEVCGKGFKLSGHIKEHMRIHTGEKPYKCGVCDRAFNQIGVLNRHQRLHTGEKRFTCDVCDKSFYHASNLKSHQRVHTGVKPYECEVCHKTFRQSSNLKSHVKVHFKGFEIESSPVFEIKEEI